MNRIRAKTTVLAGAGTLLLYIIATFKPLCKVYFCKSCLIFVVEISGVRGR